jgi:hypothetical protein
MGVWKRRPAITLRCPPSVTAGESFVATVEIDAPKPVPARAIRATLVGREFAGIGAGKTRRTARHEHVRQRAASEEAQVLNGRHVLRFGFEVPALAPPSYEGVDAWVRYRIKVEVDIPWWPDAVGEYTLEVVTPPLSAGAGEAARYVSRLGGPVGREPYLEVALDSNVVGPGEILTGAVAVQNRAWNRYRKVRLSFLGVETRKIGGRRRVVDALAMHRDLSLADVGENEPVRFQLAVPSGTAAFSGRHVALEWQLGVALDIALAPDLELRVPLVFGTTSSARRRAAKARPGPPAVGETRLRAEWAHVAEGLGLVADGVSLNGEDDGVVSLIRREPRRRTMALVAELRFPSLGLDLVVGEKGQPAERRRGRTAVRRGRGVWAGLEVWAREPAQALAFLSEVPIGEPELEILDDEHARLWRHGGDDVIVLHSFAKEVQAFARALSRARTRIPPPAWFGAYASTWAELATRLGGRLDPATLSIGGRAAWEGAPVGVAHTYAKSAVAATDVALRSVTGLQLAEALLLTRDLGGLVRGGEGVLAGEARALAETLVARADVVSLRLDRDGAVLHLVPAADAAVVAELLDPLGRLGRALAQKSGAFR